MHIYSYTHDRPDVNGINYYRIKQVDTDGDFTYSATRSVNMSDEPSVRVLPNPADDFIEIRLNEVNCTAKLFDLSGKQLKAKMLSNAVGRMELTGLATG